jgi:hypothetical protein
VPGTNCIKFPPRRGPSCSTALGILISQSQSGETSREAIAAIIHRLIQHVTQRFQEFSSHPTSSKIVSFHQQVIHPFVRNKWYMFPMMLAFVPFYCAIFQGKYAAMPEWWNVVNMDCIIASDHGRWIIGHFLGSNLSYMFSGLYLLNKFRFIRTSKKSQGSSSTGISTLKIRRTKFSMLGAWICLAGIVSTIFHSVQALGSYALAQSLCYVDHAVAFSAFAYYLHTCGFPSKKVSAIGIVALATLCITDPGYSFLHALWHYLSAAAATRWALEGYVRLARKSIKH